MKSILLCLLTWSLSFAGAFGADADWNTGYVTMPDGRKIDGQLNYNWKAEVLQVKLADGTLKAFSAARLYSFTYYDNALNLLRKFVSVALPGNDDVQRTIIMEECTVGKMSVYRRLRHTHELIKAVRPSMFSQDKELVKDYDNFTYVVIENDQAFDLTYFSTDIWPRMTQQFDLQLTEYIRNRQLDISTTVARLVLINQFNYLTIRAQEEEIGHLNAIGIPEGDAATETVPALNGGH